MAVLNEEQEMLRDMAREWATNESPVTEFRKVRASGEPKAFDRAAYATMAEMGWAGIIIPEEHGGSDFGWMSLGLVVEELGKSLAASPLIASALAASAKGSHAVATCIHFAARGALWLIRGGPVRSRG